MPSSDSASKVFRIRWLWFLGAFATGILYVYLVRPMPRIVYKYPTPYNSGKIIYSDHAGNCYKFKMDVIKCPKDSVEPQPIV